ncbi:hypothetical protein PO909_007508 [Leuciscus waleckii]
MKRRKKIKKTERKMGANNERQTSESPEKRGQRLVRCESMKDLMPYLSCDPDEPVKFDSDVKTEERFSSNPSSSSQEHTTSSLTSISS